MCVVPGRSWGHMKNSIAKGDLKGLSALDAVSSLGPDELEAQWKALYGTDPPDRLRRPLMIQALAYRIQEQALGWSEASDTTPPAQQRRRHRNALSDRES